MPLAGPWTSLLAGSHSQCLRGTLDFIVPCDAAGQMSSTNLPASRRKDYPECMKKACGERQASMKRSGATSVSQIPLAARLPAFTPGESALLRGSADFFGLNLGLDWETPNISEQFLRLSSPIAKPAKSVMHKLSWARGRGRYTPDAF